MQQAILPHNTALGAIVAYAPFTNRAQITARRTAPSGTVWLTLRCLEPACSASQTPHVCYVTEQALNLAEPAEGTVTCMCAESLRCAIHGPHVHRFARSGACRTPGCRVLACKHPEREVCGAAFGVPCRACGRVLTALGNWA